MVLLGGGKNLKVPSIFQKGVFKPITFFLKVFDCFKGKGPELVGKKKTPGHI